MTTSEWNADFIAREMHNEGVRFRTYLDSMGIPTDGVGFNETRSDWREAFTAAGIPSSDWEGVRSGAIALTMPQVIGLLNYSDAPIVPQARAELQATHFDSMSDARRCAFADLDFNMGQGELDEFHGFRGLMDQACHYAAHNLPDLAHKYFGLAADDLEGTAYAQQVGARAKRNAEMIRSSVYVAIDAFEG